MEHKVKKMTNASGEEKLIALWKQIVKAENYFVIDKNLTTPVLFLDIRNKKQRQKQKPVFRKLKKRYDGLQILATITQGWKLYAARSWENI